MADHMKSLPIESGMNPATCHFLVISRLLQICQIIKLDCPIKKRRFWKELDWRKQKAEAKQKIASHIILWSRVFKSRLKKFHQFSRCAELTPPGDDLWKRQKDFNDYKKAVCLGMYLNNFTYKTDSFVAVLLEDTYCTFWIECVESLTEDFEGNSFPLKVCWLQAKEGIYGSTYSFVFVSNAKKVRFLWLAVV